MTQYLPMFVQGQYIRAKWLEMEWELVAEKHCLSRPNPYRGMVGIIKTGHCTVGMEIQSRAYVPRLPSTSRQNWHMDHITD